MYIYIHKVPKSLQDVTAQRLSHLHGSGKGKGLAEGIKQHDAMHAMPNKAFNSREQRDIT